MSERTIYRVLVTDDVRGHGHHDTWYRRGQQFEVVPNEPPFMLGWRTIHPCDPHGGIRAEHCLVLSTRPECEHQPPEAADE